MTVERGSKRTLKGRPAAPLPPKWTMPAYLEPYRDAINNTGGNDIETLMNNHSDTVFNNAPLALLCVAVKSQIALLEKLYKIGALKGST